MMRVEGLTQVEIASRLGKSERTVRRMMISVKNTFNGLQAIEERNSMEASDSSLGDPFPKPILASPGRRTLVSGDFETELPQIGYHRFVLGKMIGQGGFGKVYRAVMQDTDEMVAIKFLRRRFWFDEKAAASLCREIILVSRLRHPGIIKHLAWGRSPHGGMFVVMELIPGENLENWIRHATPSVAEIIRVAIEVCNSLIAAHAENVFHGDLTPANVMIRQASAGAKPPPASSTATDIGVMRNESRVVVTDFGLSSTLDGLYPAMPGGTLAFLAPGQISLAFGQPGKHTDIYGVGGLLYWCLAKQSPISIESEHEALAAILSSQEIKIPQSIATSLPRELVELTQQCLKKLPAQRWHTVERLRVTLSEIAKRVESL